MLQLCGEQQYAVRISLIGASGQGKVSAFSTRKLVFAMRKKLVQDVDVCRVNVLVSFNVRHMLMCSTVSKAFMKSKAPMQGT